MKAYKGNILTVDKADSVYRYLVEDGGKIVYVGNELPDAYRRCEIADLGDRALVPAFVDTHQHFASFSIFHAGLNVMDAASNTEIVDMVRKFVADSGSKKTLIAFGASPYSVAEGKLVSRQELDSVCPDKELMVVKYDGHACIVNSRLLKKLDSKLKKLRGYHPDTGEMNQEAFFAVSNYITNSLSIPELYASMQKAVDFEASMGIGCIHTVSGVGFVANADISVEKTFAQGLQNGFQIRVFPQSMNIKVATERGLPRIGGCFECALDGCFGSHDAALNEPYSDPEGGEGVLYYDDRKVIDFCKEANRAGLQIEVHAIGDKAFDQATRALKAALDDYPRPDHRHGIIHDCLPTPEGIDICSRYNIQMPVQSAFINWKQEPDEYLEHILGHERWEKLNPIRTFKDKGILVSFGSDAPCTSPDPISWIDRAVNNANRSEAVSVRDALRMCTYNGYYTCFDEKERGSLEPGKVADMVILSKNPYAVPAEELSSIRVEQLILSGRDYVSCRENVARAALRGLMGSGHSADNGLTREEFYVLNSLYNGSMGRAGCVADIESQRALSKPELMTRLMEAGLVSRRSGGLTREGKRALEPYRVDNAVILAAGASTRFIPLSLEQPKGLFEVKGERLIERQIQQLQAAGIQDITVVLGYKKEMFYYLEAKYGVKLIVNDSFNIKNNIESLYLAREELKNTYICVSDSYFTENPFNQYEYISFNAGISVTDRRDEMYVETDGDGRIVWMREKQDGGMMLYGHAFWQADFSSMFVRLAAAARDSGEYDGSFWEWMVKDHLDSLPPIAFKEYSPDAIFEFDYFEQLRQFDDRYLCHTHSGIIRNIKLVFRCDEEDIADFRNVSKGLTNTSFIFRIDGEDYIYRHPGDGTESIINRRNEKSSLIQARKLGIDPTYIYSDVNEGWKISRFIPAFREPDYNSFDDSKKILAMLRQLHTSGVELDYGLRPWEDACRIEELLIKKDPDCFAPYQDLKAKVEKLYRSTQGDGVKKCFCHGDTYQPNWMILPDDSVILIDWEYSGFSDPGIDVGYYIVDAMYDFPEAERFVREYLGEDYTDAKFRHFMAYIAIIAYYWFVWAMYRESCGASMGDSLPNWHAMAEKYADYMQGK